jgi:hypothetical protein
MKFAIRVLLFLLRPTAAICAQETEKARKLPRIAHYIRTHKELLIADAIILLAQSADAGSTAHCQHVSPLCIETNGVIGPHPSNGAAWADAEVTAVELIVALHLFWWQANKVNPDARHIVLVFPVVDGISEYCTVTGNVAAANRLENARSRVMAK